MADLGGGADRACPLPHPFVDIFGTFCKKTLKKTVNTDHRYFFCLLPLSRIASAGPHSWIAVYGPLFSNCCLQLPFQNCCLRPPFQVLLVLVPLSRTAGFSFPFQNCWYRPPFPKLLVLAPLSRIAVCSPPFQNFCLRPPFPEMLLAAPFSGTAACAPTIWNCWFQPPSEISGSVLAYDATTATTSTRIRRHPHYLFLYIYDSLFFIVFSESVRRFLNFKYKQCGLTEFILARVNKIHIRSPRCLEM